MIYEDYLNDCFEELKSKQKRFFEKYDIESYTNWFYDQAAGIITFSKENEEINFLYHEIGTFSKKSNTWKWSWDNEHTLKKVKQEVEKVKHFGKQSGFEKLTNGLFESSEEEGWDFTSISCKVLNGFGSYRPQTENFLIFMIIYDVIDNVKAKEVKEMFVDCELHERRRRAFICKHQLDKSKVGFEEAFETYGDMEFEFEEDDFQAWCNECEKVRLEQNGWNDVSMKFAEVKVVCEKCYFEIKELNLN